MRFGLERMRRLLTALGSPQERFSAIHVVGTNGKSSTVRMTAALLEAHGVRAGAFLSPHLTSFAERIRIGDEDLAPDAFGAAVQRAAAAAAKVDRGLEAGDRVTQFELITAAAFDELARRKVQVAVVEAGLGGRHDATGVLRAPIVVLTNVGLEHTRWLGPDRRRHRAREARRGESGARRSCSARATPRSTRWRARRARGSSGPRRRAARCPATSARTSRSPARRRASSSARSTPSWSSGSPPRVIVPGRLQVVAERPLTILDGAHNPSGVEALAAALPERPFVGVVSILDDKDAAAMLRALLRALRHASSAPRRPTRARSRRRRSRRSPSSSAASAEIVPEPRAAVARAQALAGPDGAVIVTGSIYLIAELVSAPGAAEGLRAVNDRGPSVLGMVALVAVVVALTILVFFALGYAFGRMFL